MTESYRAVESGPLPKVVALVPTYNASSHVGRMLDSLAGQTYPNLSILIADDHSTDDTLLICRRFAEGRRAVRVVAHEVNLGWVANSNYLLRSSDGEYQFFAFHDDEIEPEYVSELIQALSGRPDAVVAFSDLVLESPDGRSQVVSFDRLSGVAGAYDRGRIMLEASGYWWIPFRGLVRSSAYRDVGGLQRHVLGERNSDWFWLLALALRGPFVRVPKPLYRKLKRPAGVAANWSRGPLMRGIVFLMAVRTVMVSALTLSEKVRLVVPAICRRFGRAVGLVPRMPPSS